MKNKFSSSVGESLAGRTENNALDINIQNETFIPSKAETSINIEAEEKSSSTETDQKGKLDRGLGKNIDGSFKQSNAGRRIMSKAEKKVQMPLTLTPAAKKILSEWASTKPRSAANYLSEYVEENLNVIMEYFNK